jgi:hypothetical protein
VFRLERSGDGVRAIGISGDRGDLFVWGTNRWHKIR